MNRNIAIVLAIVALIIAGAFIFGRPPEAESPVSAEQTQQISPETLFDRARSFEEDGQFEEAKKLYKTIIAEYPDYENIEATQARLEDLNMEIIFSNTPTGQTVVHEVVSGDTLGELAKKYGTTIELIKQSNNLKSNVIRVGQKLRIWTGDFNVLVDKSQNILLLREGDEVIKTYEVSTGSDNSTPVGDFTITSKLIDPVWFNRGVVVPPESPENVLGSRWLGFDIPGYGIHGTIEPETIGQQVTAGCVRMRNTDVEELYSILPLGTKVSVVN